VGGVSGVNVQDMLVIEPTLNCGMVILPAEIDVFLLLFKDLSIWFIAVKQHLLGRYYLEMA
jgi:hypothetical protein